MQIEVVRGDLTAQDVDAIVNAANSSLLGGGGVDGAIHRAAGPSLLAACREVRSTSLPDGLPTGRAVATPGFDLTARWVIHTVGPVYDAHDPSEGGDYLPAFSPPIPRRVGATGNERVPVGSRLLRSPEHLLASCHVEAMRVADEIGASTVAFPAISCGVYGYPVREAAPIAVETVRACDTSVDVVRFVLFDDRAFDAFSAAART